MVGVLLHWSSLWSMKCQCAPHTSRTMAYLYLIKYLRSHLASNQMVHSSWKLSPSVQVPMVPCISGPVRARTSSMCHSAWFNHSGADLCHCARLHCPLHSVARQYYNCAICNSLINSPFSKFNFKFNLIWKQYSRLEADYWFDYTTLEALTTKQCAILH